MTYQPATNPWENVNNPPEQARDIWGQVTINAWFCMLVPGAGKLPYDEKTLDPKTGKTPRRYTAIDVEIDPLPESGMKFPATRQMLAEFGEWKDITLPSLRDLGVLDASTIASKYARAELAPTGRKYISSNGEEREATAIKFTALYDTREQCLAAWTAAGNSPADAPAPAPAAAPTGNNGGGTPANERETALKFARALVLNASRKANKDLAAVRDILNPMLAQQPLVSKHFTVDSPEIADLMVEACA